MKRALPKLLLALFAVVLPMAAQSTYSSTLGTVIYDGQVGTINQVAFTFDNTTLGTVWFDANCSANTATFYAFYGVYEGNWTGTFPITCTENSATSFTVNAPIVVNNLALKDGNGNVKDTINLTVNKDYWSVGYHNHLTGLASLTF